MSQHLLTFIPTVKRKLPESDWPWVFSALQHDSVVWESLAAGLGRSSLERGHGAVDDFSPAGLGLAQLDLALDWDSLRASDMQPVEVPDREEQPLNPNPSHLDQATMAAMSLRERRRLLGTWEGLHSELTAASPTALAILLGIIPDPLEMLHAILVSSRWNLSTSIDVRLALHAVLSNPQPPEVRNELLIGLTKELPAEINLELVDQLSKVEPDLAGNLAQELLARQVPPYRDTASLAADPMAEIETLQKDSTIHRIAGQTGQALSLLNSSIQSARRLEAELAAQTAQIYLGEADVQAGLAAWEHACQLDPDSASHCANLALALLDASRSADAQAYLANFNGRASHPLLSLAQARLAMQREHPDEARQSALKSLNQMFKKPRSRDQVTHLTASPAIQLAELLLQVDLPDKAVQAAELAIGYSPDDTGAHALLARARCASGDLDGAVLASHIATTLEPARLDLRRDLAERLELAEDWPAAAEERALLVERSESPSDEDLYALCADSLKAGDLHRSDAICQQLLEVNPDDGLAYAYLGEIRALQGDLQHALAHHHRAIQLAPSQVIAWLSLARFYQRVEQSQKALETLRSATYAAPGHPEIHLALGELYLEQGSPTQALNDLRLAAELTAPQRDKDESTSRSYQQANLRRLSALRLGDTLAQLGHQEEACQVLEEAYTQSPSNPALAWGYAQILLAQGNLHPALIPLETVLQSEPGIISPYLEYARSLLLLHQERACDIPLERALPALESVLSTHPDHPEASALLGEVLYATGKPQEAMQAFNTALSSDLVQDPLWKVRLSLGLGKTALMLEQVETAVAALREANQLDPLNPQVQRSLSDAYSAAGLPGDAFQAARAALLLAPADVETLIWFADQALHLQNQPGINGEEAKNEAINALNRAAQIFPTRADLIVRLGQAQLRVGDDEAALQTLQQVAHQDEASICLQGTTSDYYLAAQGLLQLSDPHGAVICLERGLQAGGSPDGPTGPRLLDLLTELANARNQTGDAQGALQAIDQAIAIAPNEPTLYLTKANLLFDIQHSRKPGNLDEVEDSEALLCLEMALKLSPGDPSLHHRVAKFYRHSGNLRAAIAHAQRMVEVCEEGSPWLVCARNLAAELALAILDFERAGALADEHSHPGPKQMEGAPDWMLDYHCLRAELALDSGEYYLAVNELSSLLDLNAAHPRVLALQARMAYRRNEDEAAQDYFNAALVSAANLTKAKPIDLRALAEASLELGHWDKAIQLYQEWVKEAPTEPIAHYSLAKALVIRAEHQRLCQALEVVRRAPGEYSLASLARQTFGRALDQAQELLNQLSAEQVTHGTDLIAYWQARGVAAFDPTIQNEQGLAHLPVDPEVVAARIACMRYTGEMTRAGYIARDYPRNPLILLLLALALAGEKPRQALAAAHAAADALAETQVYHLFRSGYRAKDLVPLVQVLLARLYHGAGIRSGDHTSALLAIQNALASWPDEPRWHLIAAEITLSGDQPGEPVDIGLTISFLDQAIQYDPKFAPPYLLLGKIYLNAGSYEKAIQPCEQACRLEPDLADAWLMLAQALYALNDLDQAALHAERAVNLLPGQAAPLVLLGEIALKTGNPKIAQARALEALQLDADSAEALLLLARALEGLDRISEAVTMLDQALVNTDYPLPLLLEKVRLLSRTQGIDAASQAIQELNAKYPDDPRVLALMATLMAEAGKRDEAIHMAQRALRASGELDLQQSQDQANLHLLLGKLLCQAGQLDQAIYHLNEAVQHKPEMIEAYLELGQAHRERRQYTQALSAYDQAIEIAPNDYQPYYQMGVTLKDSKDYLAAERMLRKAAELAPDEPAVHRLLAAVIALNLVHNRREASQEFPAQYG